MQLEVRLAPGHARTDSEIAQAAVHALRWHSLVPQAAVKVEVEDGWMILAGEVDWACQSASAEQAVRPLIGVKGVQNQIRLRQRVDATELRQDLGAAFSRHAVREARDIGIEVDGGVVTLRGTVDSLVARRVAVRRP